MTDTSTEAVERLTSEERAHRMLVAALDICASERKTASVDLCANARDTLRFLAAERDALKAEVERLRGENDLMRAQLDSLPPPEPGLLKRRLLEIAEKKYSAAQQENTAHCKGD